MPKMGDEFKDHKFGTGGKGDAYKAVMREMLQRQKKGEMIYSIRRRPGVRLTGATVFTFERSGELRDECAAIPGRLLNTVQIDEDGKLYFAVNSTRLFDGKPFLAGKGGIIGSPDKRLSPWTGTFCKTAPKGVRFLTNKAPVPMGDDTPKRPPDLTGPESGGLVWAEGAEWLYAGASPMIKISCKCPTHRSYTDWYKRSYVPEIYRNSFAVLDTNGNLIMHFGRYGNIDECPGTTGKREDITMVAGRFVGATDDYLGFSDRGERITVLKLEYHATETAPVIRK